MIAEKVSPRLPTAVVEATTTDSSSPPNNLFQDLPQWKYSFWSFFLGLGEEERMFEAYMSKENSFYSHAIMTILGTMVTLFNVLRAAMSDYSFEYKMYSCQILTLLIPLWLHFYAVTQKKYPNNFRPLSISISFLGDALMFVFSVSYGTYLCGMATIDGCDSSLVPHALMCDHKFNFSGIVRYISVTIMFLILIKSRHQLAVILVIMIEIAVLSTVVSVVDPVVENYMGIVIILLSQIFVVFDSEHSRRMYLLLMESRSTMHDKIMTENENVVMEMQTTELRFLIGNVAHDLKTPLQAFSYELDLMKSHPELKKQGNTESILILESICSFMLMTINRAIDYTKVTSGIKLKPSMETVNVGEVFDWVKMCVGRTVTARPVSIVVEPFSDQICNFIITDKQWLMENLLCLLSNSLKFTAKGEIWINYSFVNSPTTNEEVTSEERKERADISSRSSVSSESYSPSMVMVEVVDDGIGISEEMMPTLFKPFKQAMRRAGGTGLGIYSLSKRVESLGGTCGVSSRADGKNGARFWFTLPYRPDVVAAASLATSPTALRNHPSPFAEAVCQPTGSSVENKAVAQVTDKETTIKDPDILLVEDSPLIQKTCARSFLREGITVDIANNGLECVEKVFASPNRYRVLLMDVNMPLMDGLEATHRIRQWERSGGVSNNHGSAGDIENIEVRESKLLIIGVSANSDSDSKQDALDAGMDRFITKPLKMSVFRACLTEFDLDFDNVKSKARN